MTIEQATLLLTQVTLHPIVAITLTPEQTATIYNNKDIQRLILSIEGSVIQGNKLTLNVSKVIPFFQGIRQDIKDAIIKKTLELAGIPIE